MTERVCKPRMNSHQIAVNKNRQDRIDHEISKKLRVLDRNSRRVRFKRGAIVRCWARIRDRDDPFAISDDETCKVHYRDTHEDDVRVLKRESDYLEDYYPVKRTKTDKNTSRHPNTPNLRGPAGLIPRESDQDAEDDFGEEAISLAAVLRRTKRRMERWECEQRCKFEARLALDQTVGQAIPLPKTSHTVKNRNLGEYSGHGDIAPEDEFYRETDPILVAPRQ